jgi:hypothetical protein
MYVEHTNVCVYWWKINDSLIFKLKHPHQPLCIDTYCIASEKGRMEESLRVVMDDNETPEKKRRETAFVEIKLDVDPFSSYYPPRDRDAWKDLRGRPRCNKMYLHREVDTVETLKFFISACFTVDIAVSNIKLRIVKETFAGSEAYRPWELNDDNEILGLHQAVRDNKLWIWVSKKVDMKMWHVLEYKVENSITIEKLEHERILIETIKEVEDKWLMFTFQDFEKFEQRSPSR